eukprot:9513399-Heterocapsa_arctica.AAC.1
MSETGCRVDAFLGWVLQLGGFFLDLNELAVLKPGAKSMAYRLKGVRVQNIDFPLRAARLEAHQHYMLMEKADLIHLADAALLSAEVDAKHFPHKVKQ